MTPEEKLAELALAGGGVATAIIAGRRIVAVCDELMLEGTFDSLGVQPFRRLTRHYDNTEVYLHDLYEVPGETS